MQIWEESTNRKSWEYVLFALAFVGILIGAAGMEGNVIALAVLGVVILLSALSGFGNSD